MRTSRFHSGDGSEDARRVLVGWLMAALELTGSTAELIRILDEAIVDLGALELESSECVVVRRRTSNARRYLSCGEIGAARYELSLLVHYLNGHEQMFEHQGHARSSRGTAWEDPLERYVA